MSAAATIAGYALRESLRRRVFAVVLLLTAGFLALYALGTAEAFHDVRGFGNGGSGGVDARDLTGATLFGLSMFATLFLGAVLAVFLTLGAIRGDAERGLLQPLVVRPLGRPALLVGRFLAGSGVCAAYVGGVYLAAMAITGIAGGWWPDRPVLAGLELIGAVIVLVALSLLGSVFLSATANGIAVFMVFGAGLTAGLLGQIGDALDSHTLRTIADVAAWTLPFEALYQSGLDAITANTHGFTRAALKLGPFGGAQNLGPLLAPWFFVYIGLVGAAALRGFQRRDL